MKKVFQQDYKRLVRLGKRIGGWVLGVGLLIIIPILCYGGLFAYYKGRAYPGIRVSGFEVGGMSREELMRNLSVLEGDFVAAEDLVLKVDPSPLTSASNELVAKVSFDGIELAYDSSLVVEEVMGVGRGKSLEQNIKEQWGAVQGKVQVDHKPKYNQQHLLELVEALAEEVDEPGAEAAITVSDESEDGVEVMPGEKGYVLDQNKVAEKVKQQIARLEIAPVRVGLELEDKTISDVQMATTKIRATKLLDKELVIALDTGDGLSDQEWTLEAKEVISFMDFVGGFNADKVKEYVESLAEAVNREPQDASFKFENGRVIEFAPGLPGIVVNEDESSQVIVRALLELEEDVEQEPVALAVRQIEPETKTPEVNDLGIQELIGRGVSTFRGSISGRIHNVALTASRLDGVLVPPGEVFSFNETIGDVSSATGYKSAYIIKDGRTILGDGGGVCQDSTTLFRAVLDAGLPIVQRKAHSYRVGYYEQNEKPGFDATVFAPSVDLKFKNDTPAHILIQAKANTETLTLEIELYGTRDGRVAEIKNYQQWGAVPAPPPLYQDDPTLTPGQVRQIDWAAPGLKVKYDYVVTKDGGTMIDETYYSTFRPWQAVYLRGV